MADAKKPKLRSTEWFGRTDRDGFVYRSWVKNRGVPHDQFDGRLVIGICNTFSELTPCNSHFRTLAQHVKHGVLEAGGFVVHSGSGGEAEVADALDRSATVLQATLA